MKKKPADYPGKKYLIRDIPPELHAAVLAKSKADKVPVRAILLAIMTAYVDGDIKLAPGKRRRRRGRRPGRSVHIEQPGLRGEAVIQPHRFSERLAGSTPGPKPKATKRPAAPPVAVPERPQTEPGPFRDAIEQLRARLL